MTQDEAVRRVQKLRRLARSSNPHEAETATAFAAALVRQYGITPAMLAYDPDEASSRDTFLVELAAMQRLQDAIAAQMSPERIIALARDVAARHDVEDRYCMLRCGALISALRRRGVRGIGRGRAYDLLERFGSIDAVLTADRDALAKVPNIGRKFADAIVESARRTA